MRLSQRILCIGIIFITVGLAQAQPPNVLPKPIKGIQLFPDSIRIEFPDQNAILLFQFQYVTEDLSKLEEFPTQLRKVDKLIRESLADVSVAKQVHVTEVSDRQWEIKIVDNPGITKIRTLAGEVEELLPPGWEVSIETSYAKIHLYIHNWADVGGILEEDFSQIVQTIKLKMDAEFIGRKRMISRTIVKENKIEFNDTKFQMPLDMLSLTASLGFGYYKNFYYPELTLNVMVVRNDHFNRQNLKFGLIYDNKFFTSSTEDGLKSEINSFLTAGVYFNLNKTGDPFWAGFGGGLLVRNKGDYFQGNTAKFFISTGAKKFTFIPEFYLTGDFKKFSLGAKISYTF